MDESKQRRAVKYVMIVTCGVVAAFVATLGSWRRIAIASAPVKHAVTARSESALAADRIFWETFHAGRYDEIQHALDRVTAAYVETPSDALTAAHVGWLHTWRVAERARNPEAAATITDDVVLGRKYFHEATTLDPEDARFLGFLATQVLSEGRVDHNERQTREGYYMLHDAVTAWPEFNLFTAGYVMSGLPPNSPQFKEGLEDQWRNIDVCAKTKIDRANPDFSKYMALDTKVGKERACWNSTIAPHNLEGFFLNMGDMLVKAGDWHTAQAIYRDAMVPKEYPTWKFQSVLADRIAHAEANVAEFNRSSGGTKMMIDSTFACMACHEE